MSEPSNKVSEKMKTSLKRSAKMSESSNKKMKLVNNIRVPTDLKIHIMSFLPIRYVLQSRVLSRDFPQTEIRSRDLDFSGLFSKKRTQLEVVSIIQNIMNQHQGDAITRFVLCLNHIDVEDTIVSWIQTCIDKKIQELELDFSPTKEIFMIPIDFSAIKSLKVLKLRWCKFEIPNNSPTGMKNLRTLSLMRTGLTKDMLQAVFNNCIDLESLELIQCTIFGPLFITAGKNKKFKRLVVSSFMARQPNIFVHAPSLEYYDYDGTVTNVTFARTIALKEAKLRYNRSFKRYYDPSHKVLANMSCFTGVSVLSTTNIFLEALTHRYVDGGLRRRVFNFVNLTEFHISFKAPTICNAFDIAAFLTNCPKLEKFFININNFTFEHEMIWLTYHKEQFENHYFKLECLKEVNIFGYKGHWHENDIVEFFVKNAPFLMQVNLMGPKRPKIKLDQLNNARLNDIRTRCKCLILLKEA